MSQNLEARRRVGIGKGAGRRIRSSGLVPAVLYGAGGPSVNLALDPRDVKKILGSTRGINSTFSLSVNGGETVTLAKFSEFQRHPLKRTLIHADIVRLDPERLVTFKVPLNLVGVGPAQKMGARIRHVTREVVVECKPADCPEQVAVDTSTMEPATIIRLADVVPGPGLRLVYNDNAPVVEAGPIAPIVKAEEDPKAKKAKGKK